MKNKILSNKISQLNVDAIVSFSPQTRLWFFEIETSNGIAFFEKDDSFLVVDGRYIEFATKNAKRVNNILLNTSLSTLIDSKKKSYKKIAIEKEYISFEELEMIKKWFPDAEIISFSAKTLRIIKTSEEIEKIQKAITISLKALNKIQSMIKKNVTEKYIDIYLDLNMKLLGANKSSFDSIVASGVRGSLPHGMASEKKLQKGEFVTIDFGAFYQGYASDITRTLHVGKVIDPKLIEIEEIVKKAQQLAIDHIKPGISTFEIDKIARDYITQKGYGDYFVHSLGHGIGIDVHELPNVSSNPNASFILEENMILTVEPGIYIPNFGGYRIEDDVLVTSKGNKVLSR